MLRYIKRETKNPLDELRTKQLEEKKKNEKSINIGIGRGKIHYKIRRKD
ncbi:MAG: hypothetical protein HFJ34_07990 [Clostridia bacterium]|nr:hypothetical protein [Clostridia bacterium]